MSLNKAIEHGKEWRKPYREAPSFDRSCRHRGGCNWCEDNRQHSNLRRTERAREKWPTTIEEFYEEFGTWA